MYLETAEAAKLLKDAMKGKSPDTRMRAGAKVIAKMNRIAEHPDVPFDRFRAQYLRDCLATREPEKSLVFLANPSFSANEKRDLLETVVALYLAMGRTKPATDWIGTVSYVFGAKAVRHLAEKPEFRALAKNKAFLKVAGKDASKNFFLAHLSEITRMWKRGEYDNLKDALFDAKSLVKDAAKLGKTHEVNAKKHLAEVVRGVEKALSKEPDLHAYLKKLI